jgi:hypothetical protein
VLWGFAVVDTARKKHGIMVQAITSAGSGKTSTCSEAGRKENNKI